MYRDRSKISENKELLVQANIALNRLLGQSQIDRDGLDALDVKNRTKIMKYSWGLFQDKINFGSKKKEDIDPIHYKGVHKCRQFLYGTKFKWDSKCPKTLDVDKLIESQQSRTQQLINQDVPNRPTSSIMALTSALENL